ncbi:FRG domain-containing protein [Geoanaerobacter pelophilus]|uniref:FRG domain-containing protein n=1 Tax=Geoanaerobacter pelophilus TaxID=60036 RepID=A0ABQ0MHC5_9BACT|nr:FRG domain-containing protein [Geoanaerobacter pelophilus]GAW66177.1 FRG domain-containing protein [Geoanaerobacter pelophilus]
MSNVVTWEEFKGLIGGLTAHNNSLLYRGQANDTWKLQTSFHRAAAVNGITMQQYVEIMIPEIHYYICANHNHIIDLSNPMEYGAFLALIQHHGFPTPLLDWTLSPYIAAYFAFREVNDTFPASEYVKMYIFDYLGWMKSFKQTLDLRDYDNPHVSVIRPYAKFNPRIIQQQGQFTISNIDDIENHLYQMSVYVKKDFLYTALLSVKEKPLVLRELNLMGINHMSLFPSIDGICEALKNQFFSAASVGPTLNEILQLRMQNFSVPEEAIAAPKRKKRRRRKKGNPSQAS